MIKISNLQRGNKLIQYLSLSSYSYDSSITSDYQIGFTINILFLSLKFHVAKPEYIFKRMAKLKKTKIQILMVLLDIPNYNSILEEIFATVKLKIILCKNYDECSRYLKGFDSCAKRGAQVLRKKESNTTTFLEAFPKINKNNAEKIETSFKNLQEFLSCNENELANLFGIGKEKAKSIVEYFTKPFKQ